MKLKKLIYSVIAVSMIAPVSFSAFSENTVQASAKSHSVSKKKAIKYAYKVSKKTGSNDGTKSDFSRNSAVLKHNKNTEVVEDYPDSSISYKVSEKGKYIKVNISAMVRPEPFHPFQKADNKFYKSYNLKRHYTFKIKKHKHHKKSHDNSANKVTIHDIKTKNYYGRKALVYYGFKHAGGVWTVNRNMDRVITFFKNSWSVWQGGEGGATNFTVKGKYVHFGQKTIGDQHKKPLIVKISTVSKYVNKHGGKHMLKSIRKLGTLHQIETLTDNGQKIIQ